MPRAFLTARWHNLILANYAVPEGLLTPLLPPGVELDRRDGQCWASLVGFQFLDTRVIGIAWPGFRNFPEWNLRFYVRHEGRRGGRVRPRVRAAVAPTRGRSLLRRDRQRPGAEEFAGQRAAGEGHLDFEAGRRHRQGHPDRVRAQAASDEARLAPVEDDAARFRQHDLGVDFPAAVGEAARRLALRQVKVAGRHVGLAPDLPGTTSASGCDLPGVGASAATGLFAANCWACCSRASRSSAALRAPAEPIPKRVSPPPHTKRTHRPPKTTTADRQPNMVRKPLPNRPA